tara:strand:- start:1249 stop:2088 length:840 start_codon:yes stop_codon:yes gene_type:complete
MSLYGKDDSNANKTKAGIGVAATSQTKQIVYIDETEAALAQNKARGLNAPGWWSYYTYNDSSGRARHKAEMMVFIANGEANSGETQADDTLAGDFLSTVSIGTQPSDASVAATNTQNFVVVATPTGEASAIDGAANAGNTAGRTAGTYTAIAATGGTGSGATVTLVVDANGAATATLVGKGGGYTDNDTLTLSRTGTYGGASDVTVNVNGVGATATYQWQVSTDGTNFADVTTGTNDTTATYTTAATAAGDNGNKYRCVVGTSQGATPVVSSAATLTVT